MNWEHLTEALVFEIFNSNLRENISHLAGEFGDVESVDHV